MQIVIFDNMKFLFYYHSALHHIQWNFDYIFYEKENNMQHLFIPNIVCHIVFVSQVAGFEFASSLLAKSQLNRRRITGTQNTSPRSPSS